MSGDSRSQKYVGFGLDKGGGRPRRGQGKERLRGTEAKVKKKEKEW